MQLRCTSKTKNVLFSQHVQYFTDFGTLVLWGWRLFICLFHTKIDSKVDKDVDIKLKIDTTVYTKVDSKVNKKRKQRTLKRQFP